MKSMAWGLWHKIKTGFKKAGNWIKKAAKTVTDKVIKPFKPIIGAVATAVNPALGLGLNAAMGAVEKFSDEGWGDSGRRAVGWASSKLNR